MSDAATATHSTTDPALRALAVATDTRLAELFGQQAKSEKHRSSAIATIRHTLGQRARYVGRRREYQVSVADTLAEARTKLDTHALTARPADEDTLREALVTIATLGEEIAGLIDSAEQLDAVWAANGHWSRYFLVEANNGHIHYDISYHRCSRQPTTEHGWYPHLSGLTEADAVAELGPRLCTTCFPSAPVEMTIGKPKPAKCAGTGRYVAATSTTGMRSYAPCPVCAELQLRTSTGVIRAHKPAKS